MSGATTSAQHGSPSTYRLRTTMGGPPASRSGCGSPDRPTPRPSVGPRGRSGGELWFVQDDFGAVGSPGAPSAVGLSLDAEAVVDLGVVAFPEQADVVQVGGAV